MVKVQQIDVTKSTQHVGDFLRRLGKIRHPLEIVLEGKVVARMVPPGELSEAEREEIVRQGWEVVQEARSRNRGRTEREIGNIVDAAVRQVRSQR